MRLTKINFQEWLLSKSPRTKVGFTAEGKTPLNRFMKQNGIVVDNMPKWAVEFENKVLSRRDIGNTISADAAYNLV